MNKILESNAKVRFQDCDPFNHLNNSKYIDYFINAREDQILKHYNLNIFEHVATFGKSWVVTSNQIAYLKPVLLMEEIIIESQLVAFSDSFLQVEMKMFNTSKTILKSILWTKFTYYDIRNKSKSKHSKELNELFIGIVNPIEKISFESRCNNIIQSSKK
jgi:YbgC/YbaW family acyl-CoA thioester hydrolase